MSEHLSDSMALCIALCIIIAVIVGFWIGAYTGQIGGEKRGYSLGLDEGKAIEKQHAQLVAELSEAGASKDNVNQLQRKLDDIKVRVDRGLIGGCKGFTIDNGGHYPHYLVTLGDSQFDAYNSGRNNTTAYSICS